MSVTVKISIVIPCYNEENFIEPTINSFLKQETQFSYEVIVADGMSTDNTIEALKKFSTNQFVRVFTNKKKTTPYALNLGIKHAKGDYIMIAGAHALYPINLIENLVSFLESSQSFSCAGTQLVTSTPNESLKAKSISLACSSLFAVGNSMFRIGVEKVTSVDTVAFGCYRKEVFNEIGNFDTELTRNQDDEFNARLIKNGMNIALLPTPVIKYYSRENFSKLSKMFYQYGLYKPMVNKKLNTPVSFRQFAPPILILSILIGLLTSSLSYLPLLTVLVFYSAFLILAGIKSQGKLNLRILISYSIVIIHFSYGLGFIIGILKIITNSRYKNPISSR